jgi:hypothetical protein
MIFPIEKKETTNDRPAKAKTRRLRALDGTPAIKSVERIRSRYQALAPVMDERMARLWAAAEAKALGRGGTAAVAKATGILGKRILAGKRDLAEAKHTPLEFAPGPRRIRRPGGGRKPLEKRDPGLFGALDALIDPAPARGDWSPLRWTCKSTRQLAAELSSLGHPVGATKVRKVLLELGYSLRGSRQGRDAPQRPGRQVQFEEINRLATAFHAEDQPVIWVEARRKRGGALELANDDSDGDERDDGWVDAGIDRETAALMVESIQQWWRRMGKSIYPSAKRLLVIADTVGKSETPGRFWKTELQRLADDIGFSVRFCHYPPGTTKWHKVEHRLVCNMTESRRGQPLESAERAVNLIAPTAVSSPSEPGSDGVARRPSEMTERLCKEWNYGVEPTIVRRA